MAAPMANSEHMRSSLFSFLSDSHSTNKHGKTHLGTILKFSNELKLFTEEKANIQNWTGHVNQCLGASKSRLEGLGLLTVLVDQCPASVFRQNCGSWLRLLMQILQSHDPIPTIHLASNCLANILNVASNMAELSRDVSTNHIPGMVSALITLKPQLKLCSLHVLSACLRHFAGPCGNFKNKLEAFLLSAIQSSSPNITLAACKCYALLPKVGGGGPGGTKYIEAWNLYCDKLLGTAHEILDQLYQDVHRESHSSLPGGVLELASPPEAEPDRTSCLLQQFLSICKCLQNLLQEDFPVSVNLPMEGILALCCRTMAVTGKMLMHRSSMEMILLSASLSSLHSAALDVLNALIISCRNHLVPHGQVVNKLFLQSLAWTSSQQPSPGKQSPYSNLRLKIYTCLQTWLEAVGASSGLESVAETLVEQVLLDAKPQVDITKLSTLAREEALVSSKKKRKVKGQSSTSQELPAHSRIDPFANSDVCYTGLQVLRLLFLQLGVKLKPDIHKDVHDFIIPLLLQIQQQAHNTLPIPYSSVACREALYRVLLACVLVPHANWPAPMHCAVRIFSLGCQDMSIKVASVCTEASVICANLLQPKVPSLHSTITLAEIKPKEKEVVHVVSSMPVLTPQTDSQQMELDSEQVNVESEQTGVDAAEKDLEILSNSDKQDPKESTSGEARTAIEQGTVDTTEQIQIPSDDDNGAEDDDEKEEKIISKVDQVITYKELESLISEAASEAKLAARNEQSSDGPNVSTTGSGGEGDKTRVEMSEEADSTGGAGKRKRDKEDGQSPEGKRKAAAEEAPTEEVSSMMSTFVDSFPDSE